MKFFVPGKTFLVGEYSVLAGGAALGLATRPYFEFDLNMDGTEQLFTEFHPDSPGGQVLGFSSRAQNLIAFKDQYGELGIRGGFGRSTAEFFAAFAPEILTHKRSFFDILKKYRDLHDDRKIRPSGADLAFQFFGDVCLADPKLNFYQTFDWIFAELDFFVVATGLKVPTHEHLSKLDLNSLNVLPEYSERVIQDYAHNREGSFLENLRTWADKLEELNLTHLNSVHLRRSLEKSARILLAKPCGALGADVMLIFFNGSDREQVKNELESKNLTIVAHSFDLAAGLATQFRNYWSEHVD